MVPERHRLRRLQMGEARHHGIRVLLGALEQGRLQVPQQTVGAIERVAHPKAQVGRDLVVARARGVQLAAGIADQLGEPRLDVHMDVLERGAERELARLDLALDALEAGDDRVALGGAQDADLGEHRGVRLRPRDVLSVQPLVEADRRINLLHERRRAAPEMAAPQSDGADLLLRDCRVTTGSD